MSYRTVSILMYSNDCKNLSYYITTVDYIQIMNISLRPGASQPTAFHRTPALINLRHNEKLRRLGTKRLHSRPPFA